MLSSSALAVFLIEALKQFIGKVAHNPGFEFSPAIMATLLVVANAVSALFLAFLGVTGYEYPTDWLAWVKALILAALSALVSAALYTWGLKPFKAFVAEFRARKAKAVKSRK